jgi:hypothetical protein
MNAGKQLATKSPEYFAQIQDPARYVQACLGKISTWRDYCTNRGLNQRWAEKLMNYYGMSADGYSSQMITSGGTEGELANLKVNDLRKLIQDQLVVVTSSRPAGVAKAINNDVKSLRNSRIGTAIAEFYLSQAGYEQQFVNACEIALTVDESYVDLSWDKDAGDPVRPNIDGKTGALDPKASPIMSGDALMRIHAPWNVARNPHVPVAKQNWHIFSILENRFDLAAKYPKFRDQILAAAQDDAKQLGLQERKDDTDNVVMHLVVHDKTPAVPEGRYSIIVGTNLVADMKLPFPEYPVDRIMPAEVIEGSTGHCPSNEVMAMEQITDALHSIVTTNNVNFGGQSLVGPPLAGVKVQEVAKGMRYFEVAVGMQDKILALQLTKTAPETFAYIDKLSAKKQEHMGSVGGTLQQQAAQGSSGSSMALIQAQAVQFNSGTQRAYFRLLSRTMTKLIGVLRVYADTPRVARIVGKSKSQGLKEFKYVGKDLDSISSIVYEMVDPVSQTVGGRINIAEMALKANLITNFRQFLTVIQTGNLDAMTAPDEDMNLLILEENEWLTEGKPVQAVITEMHADHIKAHMAVLASPQAKQDPNVVKLVLQHIQEHVNVWQDASANNPAILLATGQQPLPLPPPPGMPQAGGPGAPAGPGPGPQGPGPNVGPGPNPEAQKPKLPNMPTNPATGEPAQVPGAQP